MLSKIKKVSMLFLAGLTLVAPLATTVNAQDSEMIGDKIQYDPSVEVNNGEDITLEYWTWNQTDPAIPLSESYMELHPNVTIQIVNNPWEDYWTKLPLTLQSGGPALFNIHNSQDSLINSYLAPYEIDSNLLVEEFTGVEPHVREDSHVYYIDSVINTGNIYYNKALWEEAGLTEEDIPVTWDEFREVAKTLTKRDGDTLVQSGFNWNGETYSGMYQGLNYQKGELLFTEDGSVSYNNDVTKENLQFLVDMYEVDGVGSQDFGVESTQSFGNGQSAMVYKWGWFKGELANNYPDIEYGVFATPTFSEDTPFAYDRYNGESTPGINNNQSPEQQAVAQDFIKYILANDDYSLIAAQSYAAFPTKKSLADHEDVLNDPVLSVIAPRVDRLIWPGPFPSTVESSATQAMEEVLYNGMDIDTAVTNAQDQMDRDMRNAEFNSLESSYTHFEELAQ